MAQLKEIQNSAELALDQSQKGLSTPSLSKDHRTPVKLKHPAAPCNFFAAPTSVTQIVVPQKPDFDLMQFDEIFFNQLSDGRLICSYPDGTIALLNCNLPNKPVEYLPILPANKTRSIHELSDGFVLICLENEGNHENYFVNLDTRLTTKLDLPSVRVCSVFCNNDQTVFLGLKDGRIIHWDLKENYFNNAWQITTTENTDYALPDSVPTATPLPTLKEVNNNGLSVLGITQNEDNKLLIVLNVKNGYFSCLFDQITSNLERVQFTPYKDIKKIGKKVSNTAFYESGNFNLVYVDSASLHILEDDKVKRFDEVDKDITPLSAFALMNGRLAIAGFKEKDELQNSDHENSDEPPEVDCIVEIQSFGL